VANNGHLKVHRNQEQVLAEIERARAQIQSSVVALKQEMAIRADWRTWVRRRPGLCLTTALVVGLYLGTRD
jgi:hypothetical protein